MMRGGAKVLPSGQM